MALKLDLGCGILKQPDFVGVDCRENIGADVVHDLEKFPWPFKDNEARIILCSHLLEHIKPWLFIDFMNEAWRVLEPDGSYLVSVPYANTMTAHMDPTHTRAGFVEATWEYFNPLNNLWLIYRPKPFTIQEIDVDRTTSMNIRMVAIKRESKLVDKAVIEALIKENAI